MYIYTIPKFRGFFFSYIYDNPDYICVSLHFMGVRNQQIYAFRVTFSFYINPQLQNYQIWGQDESYQTTEGWVVFIVLFT